MFKNIYELLLIIRRVFNSKTNPIDLACLIIIKKLTVIIITIIINDNYHNFLLLISMNNEKDLILRSYESGIRACSCFIIKFWECRSGVLQ